MTTKEIFYDGETFEFDLNGASYTCKVSVFDHAEPWREHDGHGPVSEWTTRDKSSGELILSEGRNAKQYYDYAEACKIALRDGWGYMPEPLTYGQMQGPMPADQPQNVTRGGWAQASEFFATSPDNFNVAISKVFVDHKATMTPREYAANAAMRDYKYLKGWCDNNWFYATLIVTLTDDPDGQSECLGGIESNDGAYIRECAHELAGQIDPLPQIKFTHTNKERVFA